MGNTAPQDLRRRDAQAEKAVSRPERNPMAESKQSEKFYLERFGVTDRELLAAMGRVKVRDVDYADLYFEHTVDESISMEESLVKRASKSISQGVGVRATAGEKTGYAYSDEITLRQLEQAADTARYIARSPAGAASVPAIRVGKPAQHISPAAASTRSSWRATAGSGTRKRRPARPCLI